MNHDVKRDEKGRFTPKEESGYVLVPVAWINRLLITGRRTEFTTSDMMFLKGYVESAEAFVKTKL